MFGDLKLDELQRDLLDYWSSRRHGRAMPARRDIQPHEIRQLLGHLGMIDVVEEPDGSRRYRFRLIGTRMTRLIGSDVSGVYLGDVSPHPGVALMYSLYQEVSETRRPLFSRVRTVYRDGREMVADRLVLPLSDNGETVDKILFGMFFDDRLLIYGTPPFPHSDIVELQELLRIGATDDERDSD